MKGKTAWICVVVIALVGISTLSALPQTTKWSPPDKSFTVDVPKDLKLKEDRSWGSTDEPNAVKTYFAQKEKYLFMTMILKFADYPTKSLEKKFGGLWFVLGGDNDWEFTERDIKVEGLPAREYVYKNQPTKGIFIDAGDRVYVLSFHGEKQSDLDSEISKQFFNSFKLASPAKKPDKKKP